MFHNMTDDPRGTQMLMRLNLGIIKLASFLSWLRAGQTPREILNVFEKPEYIWKIQDQRSNNRMSVFLIFFILFFLSREKLSKL